MLSKKHQLVRDYNSNGKHLDYGAGTGYFVKYLIDQGLDADGIEIDSDARAYAQQQHKINLVSPGALFATAVDETYDTISMWHVLEHIHDLDQLITKLRSLLTPQGTLLVAVPNHTSTDGQKYGAKWAGYDVPRHLWHFSPATMRRLMAKHDLEVMGMKSMFFDPYYNSMLSERYQGHGMALLRGSVSGLANTVASLASVEQASSIIYIIKKQ
jgi:2-polyprenyl-3-methyl-5-hydroxy-6-metoxy-1,4-benzoquinol methylase